MNKKILKIDGISFIISIVLLLAARLCYSFVGANMVIDMLLCFVSILLVILIMIITYKSDVENVNYINILFAIAGLVLFNVVYILPFWRFTGQKGVNNSIYLIFVFFFGAKYLIYLAYTLKSKTQNMPTSLNKNPSFRVGRKYPMSSSKVFYKLFIFMGMFIFVYSIIAAIINTFLPVVDISLFF